MLKFCLTVNNVKLADKELDKEKIIETLMLYPRFILFIHIQHRGEKIIHVS